MADLRALVANCLMGGDSITRNGNAWIKDTVTIDCMNLSFDFVQKKEVVTGPISQFKKRFCETTEVIVKDVQEAKVAEVLKAIDRICWLLSFAGLSRVIRYGHEYPDGSEHLHYDSVVGTANYFRPTIDIRDGKAVKHFVEQVYNTYSRLEYRRKLNIVIDYLVQAERGGHPTELKLILVFVLLENLKDTYARSMSIPYIKGYFRKRPKPSGCDDRCSFEALLQMMFRDFGMKRGLKRIVKLRNEIIHSGVTRRRHTWQWSMYETIHDLIREYVLRLLNYRGSYLTYASAGNEQRNL